MAKKTPPPADHCDADAVPRLRPDVVERAREWNDDDDMATPWRFEHAIPAETNGWVYIGDHGALAASDYWLDQYPGANVGWTVNVNDRRAAVSFTADMDAKARSKRRVSTVEPQGETADLVERKRMFWEAVQWLLEFMAENPPGDVDTDAFEEPL